MKRKFLLICILLIISMIAGCSDQKYPQTTVAVVKDMIITEEMIQAELMEKQISLEMGKKLAELGPSEQEQTPKEIMLMALGIEEGDLSADQKRYLDYLQARTKLLSENEAFNKVIREEVLYQQAVKQGFLVTEDRAKKVLEESDDVTREQMSQTEDKEKYEKYIQHENEIFKEYGFESREGYWLKWHLAETAQGSTIQLMKNEFEKKIQEVKPNLDGYPLMIEQYNAWEDYTEYLLKKSKTEIVIDKYVLEFKGKEWLYGEWDFT